MRWEQAAVDFLITISRCHGLDRDEVLEKYVEDYWSSRRDSDTISHQDVCVAYADYRVLNPA